MVISRLQKLGGATSGDVGVIVGLGEDAGVVIEGEGVIVGFGENTGVAIVREGVIVGLGEGTGLVIIGVGVVIGGEHLDPIMRSPITITANEEPTSIFLFIPIPTNQRHK